MGTREDAHAGPRKHILGDFGGLDLRVLPASHRGLSRAEMETFRLSFDGDGLEERAEPEGRIASDSVLSHHLPFCCLTELLGAVDASGGMQGMVWYSNAWDHLRLILIRLPTVL